MKNIILAILLSTYVFLFSCSNPEKNNIIIKGKVLDKKGEPIKNAQVIILVWKEVGFDDIDYVKKEVFTDDNGFFKTDLKNAIRIDIASHAKGFAPMRKKIDEIGNILKIELKLTAIVENPSVTSNLIDFPADSIPYIGYRKYARNKATVVECLGMDFTSGMVTNNVNRLDIWPLPNQGFVSPNIFTTKKNGGIIPIFSNEVSQSLIYEHSIAPSKGYEQTYKLKGNEAGLLIKLPNGGYAKLIFRSEKVHKSIPNNGNHYEDLGISFDWIYNSTGNNLKISPKVNLEDYILEDQ